MLFGSFRRFGVAACEQTLKVQLVCDHLRACFSTRVASTSPSLEASFLASTSMNAAPPPQPPAAPPPRSGCLTTAAAVQECLPYNVTHISERESALLPLCRSLSARVVFQEQLRRASLTNVTLAAHISCRCEHKQLAGPPAAADGQRLPRCPCCRPEMSFLRNDEAAERKQTPLT